MAFFQAGKKNFLNFSAVLFYMIVGLPCQDFQSDIRYNAIGLFSTLIKESTLKIKV